MAFGIVRGVFGILLIPLRGLPGRRGEPGPELMDPEVVRQFATMAGCALDSKNTAIERLQGEIRDLEVSRDEVAKWQGVAGELERELEGQRERAAGLEGELTAARSLVEELQDKLTASEAEVEALRKESDEYATLLSKREASYCALLATVQSYVRQTEGGSRPGSVSGTPRSGSGRQNPFSTAPPTASATPERVTYWSNRLVRAGQLGAAGLVVGDIGGGGTPASVAGSPTRRGSDVDAPAPEPFTASPGSVSGTRSTTPSSARRVNAAAAAVLARAAQKGTLPQAALSGISSPSGASLGGVDAHRLAAKIASIQEGSDDESVIQVLRPSVA